QGRLAFQVALGRDRPVGRLRLLRRVEPHRPLQERLPLVFRFPLAVSGDGDRDRFQILLVRLLAVFFLGTVLPRPHQRLQVLLCLVGLREGHGGGGHRAQCQQCCFHPCVSLRALVSRHKSAAFRDIVTRRTMCGSTRTCFTLCPSSTPRMRGR